MIVSRELARKIHKDFINSGCKEFSSDWEGLDPADKEFFIGAMTYVIEEDKPLAKDIHHFWLDYMVDKGWVFAKDLDTGERLSPMMRNYVALDKESKGRYRAFFSNRPTKVN